MENNDDIRYVCSYCYTTFSRGESHIESECRDNMIEKIIDLIETFDKHTLKITYNNMLDVITEK